MFWITLIECDVAENDMILIVIGKRYIDELKGTEERKVKGRLKWMFRWC